ERAPDRDDAGRRPDALLLRRRAGHRAGREGPARPAGDHDRLGDPLGPAAGPVGGHRLAPAGPHVPAAGERVPARPVPGRAAHRDPGRRLRGRRLREPVPVAVDRGRARPGPRRDRRRRRAVHPAARRGPVRGGLLHQRPLGRVLLAVAGPGRDGARRLDRPDPRAERAARRGAGVRLREPRRGDRRHPLPPARADLRLPVRAAADAPAARLDPPAPGAHRRVPALHAAGRRAPGRDPHRRRDRPVHRAGPARRPLAVRGARLPAAAHPRPALADRGGAGRPGPGLPRPAQAVRRAVPDADAVHRGVDAGAGPGRPGAGPPARPGLLGPARRREAEVPGRQRVRGRGLGQRHQPGAGRRRATGRAGL
ncbi:MAG: Galactose-1-phosphate uridylyltransferase, partial [uncultured Corynebacteriales bacterium]